MTEYTTIQIRHSAKWFARISNVRAFTLDNGFSGQGCPVEALRFAVERMGDTLQIAKDIGRGKLRSHSNCWYEFDVKEAE